MSKKDTKKAVKAKAKPKAVRVKCECGCGGTPSKKGSRFLQGHDMKLRSKLLKISRKGSNSQARVKATAQLGSLGWT